MKRLISRFFDEFLHFLIQFSGVKTDFAYYNVFRTVAVINFIRYKQGHLINTEDMKTNVEEIIPDLTVYKDAFLAFEESNQIKIDYTFIFQLFTPYISKDYSLTYARLMDKTETNPKTLREVNFLEEFLKDVSETYDIKLINKEEIILDLHNASHLEHQEPRAGYIFDNYNYVFTKQMKHKFPQFYKHLYEGVKEYRQLVGIPVTEDGIQFLIYLIFTIWPNLLTEFRTKFDPIHVLVLSDRHVCHAEMIRDLIDYEFSEQIVVDVYRGLTFDRTTLENLEYDILVANFLLPIVEDCRTVYVEAIPIFSDIIKLNEIVDDILEKRISDRLNND